MDSIDPLRSYRNEFHIPKVSDIVKTSTNEDCDGNIYIYIIIIYILLD